MYTEDAGLTAVHIKSKVRALEGILLKSLQALEDIVPLAGESVGPLVEGISNVYNANIRCDCIGGQTLSAISIKCDAVTQASRLRLYIINSAISALIDSIKSAHTTPLLRSIAGLLATGYEPGVRLIALGDLFLLPTYISC